MDSDASNHIMTLAVRGSACRLRHVPLVSRYFSEACRDPSLWPELRVLHAAFLTEARWQSFLRWLAVRASGLHTLVFGSINFHSVRI
jgi:hypothetical protein